MINKSLITLNMIDGLGSVRIKALLEHFNEPERIIRASQKELSQVEGIGVKLAGSIIEQLQKIKIDEELKSIEENNIKIVTILDEEYSKSLKEIYDPSIVLYVKGELPKQNDLSVAIVGSRRASFYGLSTAEKLGMQLAQLGIVVVSGLARGIDTSAHKGALKAGGKTIAVLGSGLGNIYPSENKKLAEEISKNGAVVSEFPFNSSPLAFNFPRRNRIISGLSQGVVIVEAAKRSGALITANCALEQGREVFAVPGKLDSLTSSGTNKLIKQGAKLVQGIEDIIEELNIKVETKRESQDAGEPKGIELVSSEKILYDLISSDPVHIDNLVGKSGVSSSEAAKVLLNLQLKHLVKELPGKNFVRSSNG